jgi:hypothetical protein
MSERDDGIAYNQTSGGLPVLKKILCTSLLMFAFCVIALAQIPCERLTSLKLQSATITAAVAMPKGPYLPAGLPPDAAQYAKVQIPRLLQGRGGFDADGGLAH